MRVFQPVRLLWLLTSVFSFVLTLLSSERAVLEQYAAYLAPLHGAPADVSTSFGSNTNTGLLRHDSNTNEDNATESLVGGLFTIHPDWHPRLRSERFPSVEERVKLYMSNWYVPPCEKLSKYMTIKYRQRGKNESWPYLKMKDPNNKVERIGCKITPDVKFLLNRQVMEDCARPLDQLDGRLSTENRVRWRVNMRNYCAEAVELMDIMDKLDDNNVSTPLLALFGDGPGLHAGDQFDLPFIAKFRAAVTRESIAQVTKDIEKKSFCLTSLREPPKSEHHQNVYGNRLMPILWKRTYRHWEPLKKAARLDTPWEKKKNLAIWRGVMSGVPPMGNTNEEKCRLNERCNFVLNHADSKLIDCGLTNHLGILSSDLVNGTQVMKSMVDMRDIQKYKVIISMEGNDVASGLKWNLQSASVVVMRPPTRTSWAMEELLQPWVHYVPMLPDGSNAEEMVQWVLHNEKAARRIAERATLFIYDFVYHPDAEENELEVKKEILQRYRALWY